MGNICSFRKDIFVEKSKPQFFDYPEDQGIIILDYVFDASSIISDT